MWIISDSGKVAIQFRDVVALVVEEGSLIAETVQRDQYVLGQYDSEAEARSTLRSIVDAWERGEQRVVDLSRLNAGRKGEN